MKFEIQFGTHAQDDIDARPDQVFRIAIIGDFGGVASGDSHAYRMRRVDIDNFGDILSNWQPTVHLAEPAADITLDTLEDLHPDQLLASPLFDDLRRLRSALDDPAERESAARRIQALIGRRVDSPDSDRSTESMAETMDRLLGGSQENAARQPASPHNPVDELVRNALGDSAVPEKEASLEQLELAADACISERLRTILRDPATRRMESRWLGLHWLLGRLEPEEYFEIWLVDADRDQLESDLTGAEGKLDRTRLYSTFERIAGDRPVTESFDMIALVDNVGGAVRDVELLGLLAEFAALTEVWAVVGADPGLLGAKSVPDLAEPREWQRDEAVATAWQTLRRRDVASHLGVVVPGFLLRLPYGPDTDAVDGLDFEEITGEPDYDQLLWGNGALAFALLAGRGHIGAQEPVIEDLPAYAYPDADGRALLPCNGVLLSDRATKAIAEFGIMPLVWPRGSNMLRLAARHSVCMT